MFNKMKVHGFTLDSIAQMPIVILKDEGEQQTLPLWISAVEAVSMAAELIGRDVFAKTGRNDLLSLLLERLDMTVDRLLIESSPAGSNAATVVFSASDGELEVEVRLTDVLVLAIKYGMPIMVSDEVLERGRVDETAEEKGITELDARRFIDFLEKMDPTDMNKYPM
jgi:bifunctional DNase/RNase